MHAHGLHTAPQARAHACGHQHTAEAGVACIRACTKAACTQAAGCAPVHARKQTRTHFMHARTRMRKCSQPNHHPLAPTPQACRDGAPAPLWPALPQLKAQTKRGACHGRCCIQPVRACQPLLRVNNVTSPLRHHLGAHVHALSVQNAPISTTDPNAHMSLHVAAAL